MQIFTTTMDSVYFPSSARGWRSDVTTSLGKLRNFIVLTAVMMLLFSADATAAASPLATRQANSPQISGISSLPAVGLASAMSAQSYAHANHAKSASKPPIPLPSNLPAAEDLRRFVHGMPPLQVVGRDVLQSSDDSSSRHRENLRTEQWLQNLEIPNLVRRSNALEDRATLKVMIVGDSITQGREGDWTWRYRLWQWFTQTNGITVQFVGPYPGTRAPDNATAPVPPATYGSYASPPPPNTNGKYASGTASGWTGNNHFSLWDMAAATNQYLIQNMVKQYTPDVLLLSLGYNDMAYYYSGPAGTLISLYSIIKNARAANPKIKVAIANVPQRTNTGRRDLPTNIDTLNSKLAQAIPVWTTGNSPVALVQLRESYQCSLSSCPGGSDGQHPNALGEYQIAKAFSATLFNSFKYGSGALVIRPPSQLVSSPCHPILRFRRVLRASLRHGTLSLVLTVMTLCLEYQVCS